MMMLHLLAIGFFVTTAQVCAPPLITLNGYETVTVTCRQPYQELGATAWSECDQNLTPQIVVENSHVDTSVPGEYVVTYSVTDSIGQTAFALRRVIVEAYFSLTVNGYLFFVEGGASDGGRLYVTRWDCNRPYDDPGAIAWDACDGDLTRNIVVTGVLDVQAGLNDTSYLITYRVKNSRGDELYAERLVVIWDGLEPVVSLKGPGEGPINTPRESTGQWWPEAVTRYNARYPQGNPWRIFNELPSEWNILDEWVDSVEPYRWYCDLPFYQDPGALSFDECEGPINPGHVLMVLIRRAPPYTDTSWTFVDCGFLGDPGHNFPPLINFNQYRAFYISMDKSGRSPWTISPTRWRSIRSRQIMPMYTVSIIGADTDIEIACNTPFDPAANIRAVSTCEGDITARMIVAAGDLDITRPGSYRARYEAVDSYGWLGWAQRNINVVDREAPVITLLNAVGTPLVDPLLVIPWCKLRDSGEDWWQKWHVLHPGMGWIVSDACDDDVVLASNVALSGQAELHDALEFLPSVLNQSEDEVPYPVDPAPYLKTYTLYHNLLDSSRNRAQPALRFVRVVATVPTITLKVPPIYEIECGDVFGDPKSLVEVSDESEITGVETCNFDTVTELTVTVTPGGSVVTDKPGEFLINYYALNDLGKSQSASITVRVQDKTAPVVAILPKPGYTITPYLSWESGKPFAPGQIVNVLASDSCDGVLQPVGPSTGGMNFSSPQKGAYNIEYSATDRAGNTGKAILRVLVDTDEEPGDRAPEISLLGGPAVTIECGTQFNDPGATAKDEVDGDLTSKIKVFGRVDIRNTGTYQLIYSVTNTVGNSVSVKREVTVKDTYAPIITLRGQPKMRVPLGGRFVDPGVIVQDGCDGTIQAEVAGTVNMERVGTYTLTYTATDSAGNGALPLTRIVRVVTSGGLIDEEGELEGEGEGEGEPDGEGEGEAPPDCFQCKGCAGCDADKSLREQIQHFLGDYLILGLGMMMLVALGRTRRD